MMIQMLKLQEQLLQSQQYTQRMQKLMHHSSHDPYNVLELQALVIIEGYLLRRSSDSNVRPCSRKQLKVLQALVRGCDIREIGRKCEELKAIQSQTYSLDRAGRPYEMPTGATSRAAAVVGAAVGIV